MKTLHTEDFIEFSILRYILGFFALLILVTAIVGRKVLLNISFILLVGFCVVAMADFYRWNYNYGHDLDPNAAIKVPGMAYQPPLIGFKQLLNFGAYSIPDNGGWLLIGAGLLMLLAILIERRVLKKKTEMKTIKTRAVIIISMFALVACGKVGPRPVKLNQDACEFCRMTITDLKFATQATTKKGRQYVFDDAVCLVTYRKEHKDLEYDNFYAADFSRPNEFVALDQASIIESDSLRSPMGGNFAAFASQDSAQRYMTIFRARTVTWEEINR